MAAAGPMSVAPSVAPAMGPAMGQGAPRLGASPAGFDGAALERRSASMSAAGSLRLPGKSRVPLVALLLVDVGLAVAGGLLLRAGLAPPAVANAASDPGSSEKRSERRGDEAIPTAGGATAPGGGSAVGASTGASGAAGATEIAGAGGDPKAGAQGSGAASAVPPAAQPAAGASGNGGADEVGKPPADAAKPEIKPDAKTGDKGAAGSALLADGPDQSDQSDKPLTVADKKSDKAKRPTNDKASGASEGPVDPYAPPPAPASANELNAQLLKVLKRAQAKFDDCYNQVAKGVGPTELLVSFAVTPDGSLGGARVLSSQDGAQMLGHCVIAELGKLKIKGGPSTELIRRIKFQPKKKS